MPPPFHCHKRGHKRVPRRLRPSVAYDPHYKDINTTWNLADGAGEGSVYSAGAVLPYS
jgi:hypothetical protein